MINQTAIVTDTNSGMTPEEAQELGVYLLPMPFFVGDTPCLEGQPGVADTFFAKLRAGVEVSTSQPAPGDITALWDKALETHETVLHFPMSAGLSGSCQTAQLLAEDYVGRVLVVDDHRISVTMYQSIRNALVLLEQGKSAQEVKSILEWEQETASIYIAVNTLELLKKSGRVTAAGAAMASVLQIKPVLKIEGGKLDAFKKARGMNQAKRIMLSALEADLSGRFAKENMEVFAVYSGDREMGERWQKEVQKAFPDREVHIGVLPICICCHTGENALAVACARRQIAADNPARL